MAAERAQQDSLPMVTVRQFEFVRDVEAVLRFQVEIYERNFPGFIVHEGFLRDYRRQLRRAGRQWTEGLYVLCDGRRALGFLWVGLISTMVSPSVGYIKNIYTAPELRGQGWGRELLRIAEDWAEERGAGEIELDASICNEDAVGLYQRAGYETRRLRMGRRLRP